MAARKSCCAGGCLLKAIISIVIILALIAGAIIWAINQTPEKFGFADYEIEGMSLRQLGLANTKIKDIIGIVRKLFKPDEKAILNNVFDPVKDKAGADSKADQMGLPQGEGGQYDYLALVGDTPITTDNPELLSFKDTEIAFILNSIVMQASEQSEGEEEAQVVRDLNASIAQVTITKGTDITLEILLKIDISSIRNELPSIVQNSFPSVVYLNSINKMTIGQTAPNEGIISTQSSGIVINGMDGATTAIVINALAGKIAEASESEDPVKYFNDTFGAFFQKVVNNMGLVGDAELDENEAVIPATIQYGANGIVNHGIKVITREQA